MSVDFSKGLLNPTEINLASDFPTNPDVEVAYQINAALTVPVGKPGAGQVFAAGDVVAWDSDRGDGQGEYVLIYKQVPDFDFNRVTGLATVTLPDGTVSKSWQCSVIKEGLNIVGWAWPSTLQADLPMPDVNVVNVDGTVVGKAYSAPIAGYWDIPVANMAGTVTHYAASGLLPDGNYIEVKSLAGTTLYHILAP